jgi:hypothetical protein
MTTLIPGIWLFILFLNFWINNQSIIYMEYNDWIQDALQQKCELTDLTNFKKVDEEIKTLRFNFIESDVYKRWENWMKDTSQYSKFKGIARESLWTLAELCSLYSIELEVLVEDEPENQGTVSGKKISEKGLDFLVPMMIVEFSLYPSSIINKIEIKALTLGEEFYVGGQYRAAVPDWFDFKMKYASKDILPDYIAKGVHHEIYHYFDYKIDGKIYGGDPDWERLNFDGFSYLSAGKNYTDPIMDEQPIPGFFNFYSKTAVEEDKAEVFKYLVVEYDKIISHEDPIIVSKALFLKEEMENWDSHVTEEWWEYLREATTKRSYVSGKIGY